MLTCSAFLFVHRAKKEQKTVSRLGELLNAVTLFDDPIYHQEVRFLPQCFKSLLLFPTFAVTDCTFNIFMNKAGLNRQKQKSSVIT